MFSIQAAELMAKYRKAAKDILHRNNLNSKV